MKKDEEFRSRLLGFTRLSTLVLSATRVMRLGEKEMTWRSNESNLPEKNKNTVVIMKKSIVITERKRD